MPALRAPRLRLASAAWRSPGRCTWRARTVAPNPGATCSTASSIRCTCRSSASSSVDRCRGRWVYAQTDSVPAGDRVGSAVVIWPSSMNGWRGIRPTERSAATSTSPSSSTPRCTVPAPRAPGAAHGMGSSSAQLTLRVASSQSNRRTSSQEPGRQVPRRRRGRRRARARGRRRAPRAGPARSCRRRAAPPRARPQETCTAVTGTPHRTCTPSDSARRRSAVASTPAPPSGTGKPTSWPSITSSHPNSALPALSGDTSLCMALPLNRTRASSLPNSSRPSRRTDDSPRRVRSRVPATPGAAQQRAGLTAPGGTA